MHRHHRRNPEPRPPLRHHPGGACRRGLLIAFVLALPTSVAQAVSGPWVEHPEVRLRLISGWNVAPVTRELELGAELQLASGWHAYWKNPGDAGYAPRFEWTSRPSAQDFELLWPAPQRFLLPGDLQSLGYADHVIYPVRVRFPSPLGDTASIETRVDYLVCSSDTCVPYRDSLRLELPVNANERRDEANWQRLRNWRGRVPAATMDDGSRPGARLAIDGERLTLRFTSLETGVDSPELFFAAHSLFELGPPARRPGDGLIFEIPIRRRDRTRPLPPSTTFDWTLTGVTRSSRGALEGTTAIRLSAGDGEPKG